jgi:hypothetical protein
MIIGDTVKINSEEPRPWMRGLEGTVIDILGWGKVRVQLVGKPYTQVVMRGYLEVIRRSEQEVNGEHHRLW